MADEQITNSNDTNYNPEVNQDELIMAQEKQIEREIAETTPLVGPKQELATLQKEYSDEDCVYQQKVKDLRSKYQSIRRTRGDGNCFFRAVTFAYLEKLLEDRQDYERFKDFASRSKDELVKLGFPQLTIEDFHDTFMEVVEKVGEQISLDQLIEIFNDPSFSDYMVVYMRLLTSGQLQKDGEFYANFVEGDRSVKEFCHQEVEPMYKESDHIHIIALTSTLGIGVRIQYMDRGEGGKVITISFTNDTYELPVEMCALPEALQLGSISISASISSCEDAIRHLNVVTTYYFEWSILDDHVS